MQVSRVPLTFTNLADVPATTVAYACVNLPPAVIQQALLQSLTNNVNDAVDDLGNAYPVTYTIISDRLVRLYVAGTFQPGDTTLHLGIGTGAKSRRGFTPQNFMLAHGAYFVVDYFEVGENGEKKDRSQTLPVNFGSEIATKGKVNIGNQNVMSLVWEDVQGGLGFKLEVRAHRGEPGVRWDFAIANPELTPHSVKQGAFSKQSTKNFYVRSATLVVPKEITPSEFPVGTKFISPGKPLHGADASLGPIRVNRGEERGAMQFYTVRHPSDVPPNTPLRSSLERMGTADAYVCNFFGSPIPEGQAYTAEYRPGETIPDNADLPNLRKVDEFSIGAQRLIGGKMIRMSGFIGGAIDPNVLAYPVTGRYADIGLYRTAFPASFAPIDVDVNSPQRHNDIETRAERFLAAMTDVNLCDNQPTIGQWDYHRHKERGALYEELGLSNPYYGFRDHGSTRWGDGVLSGDRYTMAEGFFYQFLRGGKPGMLKAFIPQVENLTTAGWLYEFNYQREPRPQSAVGYEYEKGAHRAGAANSPQWMTHAWLGGLTYAWAWYGDLWAQRCLDQHRFQIEQFGTFGGDQVPTDWVVGSAKDPRDFGSGDPRYGQYSKDPETKAGRHGDYGDYGDRKYGWSLRNAVRLYCLGMIDAAPITTIINNMIRVEVGQWGGNGYILNRKHGHTIEPHTQPWQLVICATGLAEALHMVDELKHPIYQPFHALLHRLLDNVADSIIHGENGIPARLAPWFNAAEGPTHTRRYGVSGQVRVGLRAVKTRLEAGAPFSEVAEILTPTLQLVCADVAKVSDRGAHVYSKLLDYRLSFELLTAQVVAAASAPAPEAPEAAEDGPESTIAAEPEAEAASVPKELRTAARTAIVNLVGAKAINKATGDQLRAALYKSAEVWENAVLTFIGRADQSRPAVVASAMEAFNAVRDFKDGAEASARMSLQNVAALHVAATHAEISGDSDPAEPAPTHAYFLQEVVKLLQGWHVVSEITTGAGVNYTTITSDLFCFAAEHFGRPDLLPHAKRMAETWVWHHQVGSNLWAFPAPNVNPSYINYRRTSAPSSEIKFCGPLLGMTSWVMEQLHRFTQPEEIEALYGEDEASIFRQDSDVEFSPSAATHMAGNDMADMLELEEEVREPRPIPHPDYNADA